MRILHINDHGRPYGGAEAFLAELAGALEADGHPNALLYRADARADGPLLLARASAVAWPAWPEPIASVAADLEVAIGAFRPDLVCLHAVAHPGLIDWVARRWPSLVYAHGAHLVCPGSAQYLRRSRRACPRSHGPGCLIKAQTEGCCWGRNPWRHWQAVRRCRDFVSAMGRAEGVLAGSHYMCGLLERGGLDPAAVEILAPCLVDIAPGEPRPEPEILAQATAPRILFAGRLVPEKGLVDLVEALSMLRLPWHLVVAGEGPDRPAAEGLAAGLGFEARLDFRGWLDPEALGEAIADAVVVASPSLVPESFGRVGVEAAARGRPVVAYDSGGIRDWLEDGRTGYRVPAGDRIGLATAIEGLLGQAELRREMGSRAWRLAHERYAVDVQRQRFLERAERARQSFHANAENREAGT